MICIHYDIWIFMYWHRPCSVEASITEQSLVHCQPRSSMITTQKHHRDLRSRIVLRRNPVSGKMKIIGVACVRASCGGLIAFHVDSVSPKERGNRVKYASHTLIGEHGGLGWCAHTLQASSRT